MRLIALAALSALTLSACSPSEEPAPPAAPPEPAPMLGGVDLGKPVLARGTEPFWSVELTGTEMVYGGLDRPEQRAPQSKATVQGTTATFEGVTGAGTPLSVMLVATECSDGMSDLSYPLTAIVRIGDESLNGCAGASAALRTAGEGGPAAEPAQPPA